MPSFKIISEVILQWWSNIMACDLVFCMVKLEFGIGGVGSQPRSHISINSNK